MSSDNCLQLEIGGDPKKRNYKKLMSLLNLDDDSRSEWEVQEGEDFLLIFAPSEDFYVFDKVTAFCRKIGLPYTLGCRADADQESSLRWWVPGAGERETYCTQETFEQLVSVAELQKWQDDGKTLQEFLDRCVPPLPPFKSYDL